jgi:hypothetical protein
MDISTNNALTAISYGAAAVTVTMAAANVVLVGTGAGAKAGAFVADYFKNESVAQNLRIKGDQLISLAGKYAATELKVAAALVAVGGSVALAQYSQDNANPCDKNDDICNKVQSYEKLGMCFDKKVNLTKDAKEGMSDVIVIDKNKKLKDYFPSKEAIAKGVYSVVIKFFPISC